MSRRIIGITGDLELSYKLAKTLQFLVAERTPAAKSIGMHETIHQYINGSDTSGASDVFYVKPLRHKIKLMTSVLVGNFTSSDMDDQKFLNKPMIIGNKTMLTPADVMDGLRAYIHRAYGSTALLEFMFRSYKKRKAREPARNGCDISSLYSHKCKDCGKDFIGYKLQKFCINCFETRNWYPSWIIPDVSNNDELEYIINKGGVNIRIEYSDIRSILESEWATNLTANTIVLNRDYKNDELIKFAKTILMDYKIIDDEKEYIS